MAKNKNPLEEEEINILDLILKIWKSKFFLLKISVFSVMFGMIYAISSPNIYTASTTFLPKNKNSVSSDGGIGGLASLAGINIASVTKNNSDIPTNLYPTFLTSFSFMDALLKMKIRKNEKEITFKNYLIEKKSTSVFSFIANYTIGLPSLIKNAISNNLNKPPQTQSKNIRIRKMSEQEESLYNSISSALSISTDGKTGLITLSFESPDPEVAAIITQEAQKLFQEEMIKFKIKDAQESLFYTEKLFNEKKVEFEYLQDEIAKFRDQNQSITSGLFRNKLSRLESELSVLGSVYKDLAKQVEGAKIQVSKDTPLFTTIKPVLIPNKKSSPQRTNQVLTSLFIGLLIGIIYILSKDTIRSIKNNTN